MVPTKPSLWLFVSSFSVDTINPQFLQTPLDPTHVSAATVYCGVRLHPFVAQKNFSSSLSGRQPKS